MFYEIDDRPFDSKIVSHFYSFEWSVLLLFKTRREFLQSTKISAWLTYQNSVYTFKPSKITKWVILNCVNTWVVSSHGAVLDWLMLVSVPQINLCQSEISDKMLNNITRIDDDDAHWHRYWYTIHISGESSFVRNTCPNIGRGFDEWAFKVEKLNLNPNCLKTRLWAGVGILVAWRQEEIE